MSKPEISNFDRPICSDQDVLWLQVQVHHLPRVHVLEATGDLLDAEPDHFVREWFIPNDQVKEFTHSCELKAGNCLLRLVILCVRDKGAFTAVDELDDVCVVTKSRETPHLPPEIVFFTFVVDLDSEVFTFVIGGLEHIC